MSPPLNVWYTDIVERITEKEAYKILERIRDGEPIIIEFISDDSDPTHKTFDICKRDWEKVIFMRVKINETPSLARDFSVISTPTVVVAVKRGNSNCQCIERVYGTISPDILRTVLSNALHPHDGTGYGNPNDSDSDSYGAADSVSSYSSTESSE